MFHDCVNTHVDHRRKAERTALWQLTELVHSALSIYD